MTRIRLSRKAEQDLDDIWREIATRSGSIEIADGAVDTIGDVLALLARNPEAGRRRDEIEPGVRSFPAGNYLVYYRRSGSHVVIARVIHGMRDQATAYIPTHD